jgi:hypothetical protein
MWVGEWTYTISSQDAQGTMDFEWFGDRLIRAEEHTAGGSDILHVMGYDPEQDLFLWRRYWNTGQVDFGEGWFEDNTWTFLFTEEVGTIVRMTMEFETPNDVNFNWARSVRGGPWEVMSQGRTTRVR